jgi:hypothetical protein
MKRYMGGKWGVYEHERGDYVKLTDHEAALAEAVVKDRDEIIAFVSNHYQAYPNLVGLFDAIRALPVGE